MMMNKLLLIIILLILISYEILGQNQSNIMTDQQNGEWHIVSEVPSGMSALYFIDSLKGWVIGTGGKIIASDDGGFTWSPQNSGTANTLGSIYFMNNEIGFASGYNRTLLSTHNKGITWVSIPVVSDTGTIYSSLCSDSQKNLYFISNYGEVFCSQDSGLSWQNKFNMHQWGFTYLNYSNDPICFSMKFMGNTLYKSTDGGTVWQALAVPLQWSGDICFLNSDTGWVTENWAPSSSRHDSVSMYFTSNGGNTWIRQSTLPGLSLDNIIFTNISEGWASMVTKIYHTCDRGQTWVCQFESDSIGFIQDIFFLNNGNGWAVSNQGKIIRYFKSSTVNVDNTDIHPHEYIVNQNYPNPFNPSTNICFSIPSNRYVTLKIYNVLGKEVATLVSQEKPSGSYNVQWDGYGQASGIYFYRLTIGSYVTTKKMVLIK
jgi:photosystem II stability/assembly factor-like uncharacterized protein